MPQGFDVEAARKAGYSDDDILSHLTSTRKFDIDGALKAGYSKQDIIGHLATTPAPAAAAAPSDDDLIQQFGFDPKVIKSSPRYQANLKERGSGLAFLMTDPNRQDWAAKVADSPLGDLGMGAFDAVSGAAQLVRHGLNKIGLLSDADTQYSDLALRVINQDYAQNVRHGKPGTIARLAGNVVAPTPGASLIRGAGTAAALGRAAVTGATAAATQPVEAGPEGFWAGKAGQAASGAVVGPVVGAAAMGAGKVVGKVINAATGREIPAEAAELMRLEKEFETPLTYGDITRKAGPRKVETLLEEVPYGASPMRRQGQAGAKRTAGNLRAQLEERFKQTKLGGRGVDDLIKAADKGDNTATEVLYALENAGDDPDKVLRASIGLQDWRTAQNAQKLYSRVDEIAKEKGLGDVTLTRTTEALNQTLAQGEASKLPSDHALRILKKAQKNIGKGGNDYAAMRELSDALEDEIRSYQKGANALIGQRGVGYLQRVKAAIDADLRAFAKESRVPELWRAHEAADSYYRTERVPFKDAMLAKAGTTDEPDRIFQMFVQQGGGDRAQKFYNGLDAKGQAAVRYKMVAKAVDDATDAGTGTFSPQTFFSSLEKVKEAYGIFFKGTDKFAVDGFKKLMSHATRIGQFGENPPTGNRVVPWLVYGIGGLTAPIAIPAAALAKFAFTTNAGKKFLLSASSLKAGSPALDKLIQDFVQKTPALTGRAINQPATATSGE